MTKAKRPTPPDLRQIRRALLTAVASDDVLVELLVLKGGNALELIHRLGERASLDLDFSMEGDAEDAGDLEARLRRAAEDRLDSLGLVVLDWLFGPRPQSPRDGMQRWGGYRAEFKVIERELATRLGGKLEDLRRQAIELEPGHARVFKIDISKFEFCRGYTTAEVDAYELQVYTPAMIAAEKLRAICQQMPEYLRRLHPAPRPRDYYDIHAIVEGARVRLPDEQELIRQMFLAKEVPLRLLGFISRERERSFHGQAFSAVEQAVRGEVRPFDFYFDFVGSAVKELEPLWEVDPPLR